jgi:hypothetical protein
MNGSKLRREIQNFKHKIFVFFKMTHLQVIWTSSISFFNVVILNVFQFRN